LALRGVVLFVLRAASGIAEATMDADGSGKAKSPGFYVSHNPQTRAVFVEALGYGNSERQMLDADALNRLVQVLPANMVRVSDLTDAQIATLRARYSV
jgi:hypothetical protein